MSAVGFPAFPPTGTAAKGAVRRGQSWWARAWVRAMEEFALDAGPLKKGRAYARTGRVGPITVGPGAVQARVQDDDGEMYHTVVSLEPLTDDEWDRFLHALASRSGRLAALLAGEMPRDVVAAAVDADVSLLPGIGDLEPECDCPTWDLPCLHAAALSYQAGWLLDADPFVLFLLRGRTREQILDALRDLSSPGHAAEQEAIRVDAPPDPADTPASSTRTGQAPSGPRVVGELPPPPDVPEPLAAADLLPGVPDETGDGTPVDLAGLRTVLAAAARSAAERLTALDR
ncbi:SWIM zinc finger family protein [Oerskovia paurometabola]|uniref:SWIM zinc finger family protein n=1 Tax=Oerskovia paurometabola TaxID=162170 RepID=A0ABW1X4Q7_9CELL|nr:SWIM zinc finger family protein [Oerskovia paurometabola]MBM7496091.1 putative Zn finger protein [Oerskovia paurometabola]